MSSGTAVPAYELQAVGTIGGCTATLISQELVLTAAHCVCPSSGRTNCQTRATFTIYGDKKISIAGDVLVHPEYGKKGWLREDLAVIHLDKPVYQESKNVTPIPVEELHNVPKKGENLTLVGYGVTGPGCKEPSKGKMKLTLPVHDISDGYIRFKYNKKHVCSGDSGGPVINTKGHVVGVASWGNNYDESTYRPTHSSYAWIFSAPRSKREGACSWIGVESAGVNSHQPKTWCPNGSFLVGFDLDGEWEYAAHDAPVVRQARCCKATNKWGICLWVEVGAPRSHQPWLEWCPAGTFMTSFDLDGERTLSEHDAPIVGRARCS